MTKRTKRMPKPKGPSTAAPAPAPRPQAPGAKLAVDAREDSERLSSYNADVARGRAWAFGGP